MKLHIFFTPPDNLLIDVPKLFHANQSALSAAGITYHFEKANNNPYRIIYGFPFHLGVLGNPAAKQRANSERIVAAKLAFLNSESGKDHIVVMPVLTERALQALKQWLLDKYPHLDISVTLIAQRQDFSFTKIGLSNWGIEAWAAIHKRLLASPHCIDYNKSYAAIQRAFGQSNSAFIPYPGYLAASIAQTRLAQKVAQRLLLPTSAFENQEPWPIPESFAGLNLQWALSDFPFTLGKVWKFSQEDVLSLIRKVEANENFLKFTGMVKGCTDALMAQAESWNRALTQQLGNDPFADFPDYEQLPAADSSYPGITIEQAQPFVAAFPEEFRAALLPYFRGRSEQLLPCQMAIAQALEHYQTTHCWRQNFKLQTPKPLLTVLTMTYNHKNFIGKCMESVAEQRTDFAIEHIIIDDCSNDGTQDIVDNYASGHSHVRPIYLPRRSQGGKHVRTLFAACRSEFASLCDGDDYFTEPQKLQKQIDFLARNPEASLCFHPVAVVFEDNSKDTFLFPSGNNLPGGFKKFYEVADLIQANFIQTNSVVYRWRFKDGLPNWFRCDLCPADWYWHLIHADLGKIGFIPEVMSVYRRHRTAIYANAFVNQTEHMRKHGMGELKTYDVINKFFHGKYFPSLQYLANGVFANFFQIHLDEQDNSLMEAASAKYPEFAVNFLRTIRKKKA